jgi:hypothetical protein
VLRVGLLTAKSQEEVDRAPEPGVGASSQREPYRTKVGPIGGTFVPT